MTVNRVIELVKSEIGFEELNMSTSTATVCRDRNTLFRRVTQPIWLLSIGSLFAGFGVYLLINHLVEPTNFIHCALDDYIPFFADFALVYVFWFAFLPGGFIQMLWHRDDDSPKAHTDFNRFIWLFFVSWGICLVAYVLYPHAIDFRPSPEEIGYDTFCSGGLALTYEGFDLPRNVLPSLHCTSTLAVTLAVLSSDFVKRSPFKALYYTYYILFASMIICSTVLVKQHSIIDCVVSAIELAVLYPLVYCINWAPFKNCVAAIFFRKKKVKA